MLAFIKKTRKTILRSFSLSLVAGIFFLCASTTGAIGSSDFSISLNPKNPSPSENVTAYISTFQFDKERAEIIWEVDGKIFERGVGKTSIDIEAPELGGKKTITAYVTTNDDVSNSKTTVIVGNDIDFLWEAQTYVPYWYKGKALPSIGSQIKLIAIPHLFLNGSELSGNSLNYEWHVDYVKDTLRSGLGKDFFVFRLDGYSDSIVGLRVSDMGQTVYTERAFALSAEGKPEILFYRYNPLEGVSSNKVLDGGIDLMTSEIGIRAEPFFFLLDNLNDLVYSWQMNGLGVLPEEGNKNILSLRSEKNQKGIANISLSIKSTANVLQKAYESVKINF